MKRNYVGPLLVALATSWGCVPNPEPECYDRPVEGDGPWILTDHYHARKQNNEDYVLKKDVHSYQGVFGFRRAFDHLERGGYNWSSIRTMELSPERLHGFDVLFINLLSSDRPDFTDDEVAAIIDFVEEGGGLVVIGDHTNVYRHAERINRFLIPMGLEMLYHIAVDYPPEHSVAGLGWILADDMTDHDVAKGVEMISLQTGGPMHSENREGAVAWSSEESFADYWDPEDEGGYYGNWKWDGDEDLEPLGPLEVHSAMEFGDGRVVLAGDQNMFGDAWLNMVDNLQVWSNSMEWAAQQDDVVDLPLRDLKPAGTLVGLNQRKTEFRAGKPGGEGFFAFFVNTNRDREITGRGSIRFDNAEDVLMILNPLTEFTEGEIDAVRDYLRAGKKVIVSFEPDSVQEAAVGLLNGLAPDFELTSGSDTVALDTLTELEPERIEGSLLPAQSDYLDVDGLEIGSYDADPSEEDVEPDQYPPYLWDVTSEWGKPFLQAKDGSKTVDLARVKEVDGGELIIFIQDGVFRNRSQGKYLRSPRPYHLDNTELEYRLLNYVKVEDAPEAPSDDTPATRVCK